MGVKIVPPILMIIMTEKAKDYFFAKPNSFLLKLVERIPKK